MIRNLLNTGTVFNYSADDQGFINDLLNADIGNTIEVIDGVEHTSDKTFEEED